VIDGRGGGGTRCGFGRSRSQAELSATRFILLTSEDRLGDLT